MIKSQICGLLRVIQSNKFIHPKLVMYNFKIDIEVYKSFGDKE